MQQLVPECVANKTCKVICIISNNNKNGYQMPEDDGKPLISAAQVQPMKTSPGVTVKCSTATCGRFKEEEYSS